MRSILAVVPLVAVLGCPNSQPPEAAAPPSVASPAATKPTAPRAMFKTIELTAGTRTKVADGIDVTFNSHTHKAVEGGDSPLGISMTVHRDGKDIPVYEWIDVPGTPQFTAAGITFEYIAHQYDRSMKLEVVNVGPAKPN